jgi:hypothetical protein
MKQIIIRMCVALIMCAVTSVIRFTSFIVISPTLQVHAESIWILRLILASVLSPLLYNFLDKRTSNWTIRAKHKPERDGSRSISSVRQSTFNSSYERHFSNPDISGSR